MRECRKCGSEYLVPTMIEGEEVDDCLHCGEEHYP